MKIKSEIGNGKWKINKIIYLVKNQSLVRIDNFDTRD